MSKPPSAVAAVFDDMPPPLRTRLMELREIIFDVADTTDGIGPLTETLKWGQPSYLTEETKSGVTVRLGALKDAPDSCAVFVTCSSGVIDTLRNRVPELTFGGNRAIELPLEGPLPEVPLTRAIALALTYNRWK